MSQYFDSFDAIVDERDSLQGQLEAMADTASDEASRLEDRIDQLDTFIANETVHSVAVIDAALEQYHGELNGAQSLLDSGYNEFANLHAYGESLFRRRYFGLHDNDCKYVDFAAYGEDKLQNACYSVAGEIIIIWHR